MADVATLVFDIDSSQARGAAKVLADFNSAAINAANGAAKFEKTMRGADGRFRSTAKYLEDNRREVEQLAQAYNPVLAAQIRYRDESIRTGAAVKAGVITEQQRVDILQRTKAALDSTAASATRFGQSQQVAGHHVANLSFQLNDIGMMMAMGQNPFMLMIQQGPQVAQIFSQMNAEGRKIGPTLAGAFTMFLNPTTAVTLALIGGAAALGQWGFAALGAGKDTKSLEDSIGDLNSSLSDIKKYSEISKKSILELSKEFGSYAWAVRDSANALIELERAEYRAGIVKAVAAAREEYGKLGVDVDAIRAKLDELPESMRFSAAAAPLIASLAQAEQKVADLAKQIGISDQEAKELSAALMRVGQASNFNQMEGELRSISDLMRRFNIDASMLPDEIRKAILEWERLNFSISSSSGEISKATSQTLTWQSAMSGVLSYINAIGQSLSSISGTGINLASIRAEREALAKGASLEQAALAGERSRSLSESRQRTHELEKQHGILGRMLGIAESATKQYEISEAAALAADRAAKVAADRDAARSGGGGGGGGVTERRMAAELKAAEKGFQSLSELMEQNTLFEYAEYNKRQAALDAALNKQLITRQNYEAMKAQLQTLYFGTEYEQQNLRFMMEQQQLDAALEQRKISEERHAQEVSRIRAAQQNAALSGYATFFGNMAQAAQAGGDRTSKIVKAFSIAQGILNSYLAYTQVLADPSLMGRPFLRTALAASTLAAGLGAVAQMKSGGGGGGVQSKASATQEPTRNVLVRLEGPDWMQDMASDIITQIHDQSKDGRLIISRDY